MKISKIILASAVAFGLFAAGCAKENTPVENKKEHHAKSHCYSSKVGKECTKKDTKK